MRTTLMTLFPPFGGRWAAERLGWGGSFRQLSANRKHGCLTPHPSGSASHLPPQGGKGVLS